MYIDDRMDNRTRAHMLVRQLVDKHDPLYGIGSLTCSIYDTAWVSMVTKSIEGHTQWLYPDAFECLLKTQHHDGGWHSSSCDTDGILNTLAALLALCKHVTTPHQLQHLQDDLEHRRTRAVYYLETNLSQWDVSATTSDGFEILVPKLLHLVAAEGFDFHFAGRAVLEDLRAKAAVKINPSLLYSAVRSSAARFLEGLIGEIDFDRVSQHRISGSIMSSPASTAAYLIHSTIWDQDAEDYLTHILSVGNERSFGGVPSQYPSTVFEVTQALSVLLANGFSHEELGFSYLENATDFLEACLQIDAGVTGSAPYMEADADNTAQTLSTLCSIGRIPSAQGLIVRFETRDFFKTYTQERNPSFRTNCLVLKALLDLLPGNTEQGLQIEKTLKFIVNCWWTTNGRIEDQSNSVSNFPIMLMVNALVRLVDLWETGFAPILDKASLREKTFICLYQALTRTMQDQNANGSWGCQPHCEATAYAVLTLSRLARFPSAPRVKAQLVQAVEKGRQFLADNFRPFSEPDHVWRGKTTAGSSILFQVYILAALQAPIPNNLNSRSIETMYQVSLAKIVIQTKHYARQPWFAKIPEWQIQACLVESQLFLPQLKQARYVIFPETYLEEDRYFEMIPFMWLAANTLKRRFIGPEFLYQMMIVSFLNRQLDDYIAHHITDGFAGCLFEVEDILQDIFHDLEHISHKDQCYNDAHESTKRRSSISTNATIISAEVRSVLYRFASHIVNHPYVLMASHRDQAQLRTEFLAFLLSRINLGLEQPKSAPDITHLEETPGSDQTHHAYTLAFFSCLVGNQSNENGLGLRYDFLDTPEQQYLCTAMCRHLSIVSFMYSILPDEILSRPQRYLMPAVSGMSNSDIEKRYTKSVSSASSISTYSDGDISPVSAVSSNSSAPCVSPIEYFSKTSKEPAANQLDQSLQLTRLLNHERRCLNVCLQSLDAAGVNKATANILHLFVDVSELIEMLLRDPNIGSCQPSSAIEATSQACILQPPPTPPARALSRGSAVNNRGELNVEPLKPKRDNSQESSTSNESLALDRNQKPTKLASTPVPQRSFNFHRPRPSASARHPSQSSIEMSRIERIMHDMGDSTLSRAKKTSTESLPKPRINPMLKQFIPNRSRAVTTGESIYSLLPRDQTNLDAHKRLISAPIPGSADAETIKLAKANMQAQRTLSIKQTQQLESERLARIKGEEAEMRKRASSLQNQAMFEVARSASVSQMPLPKKAKEPKSISGKEKVRRQASKSDVQNESDVPDEKGWVKAPPPVPAGKTVELGDGSSEKKLQRASRLGRPKLKLPF